MGCVGNFETARHGSRQGKAGLCNQRKIGGWVGTWVVHLKDGRGWFSGNRKNTKYLSPFQHGKKPDQLLSSNLKTVKIWILFIERQNGNPQMSEKQGVDMGGGVTGVGVV